MKRGAIILIKIFLKIMSIYEKNSNRNQDNKDLLLGIYIIAIFLLKKNTI